MADQAPHRAFAEAVHEAAADRAKGAAVEVVDANGGTPPRMNVRSRARFLPPASRAHARRMLAEAVRFELTKGCPLPVFKTGAFNHSATLPFFLPQSAGFGSD